MEFRQRLGSSGFAEVFEGSFNGYPVAIKKMKSSTKNLTATNESFEAEANLPALFDPNVIHIFATIREPEKLIINPGRLYLRCGDNNKCKFFRWADEPVLKENFKDPLSIHDWLQDSIPPADPPPIYGESLPQAEQRLQQVKVGFNRTNFEKDYVPLHKDVIERGKLGLF